MVNSQLFQIHGATKLASKSLWDFFFANFALKLPEEACWPSAHSSLSRDLDQLYSYTHFPCCLLPISNLSQSNPLASPTASCCLHPPPPHPVWGRNSHCLSWHKSYPASSCSPILSLLHQHPHSSCPCTLVPGCHSLLAFSSFPLPFLLQIAFPKFSFVRVGPSPLFPGLHQDALCPASASPSPPSDPFLPCNGLNLILLLSHPASSPNLHLQNQSEFSSNNFVTIH